MSMLNDLDRRTLCCHAGVYITLQFAPSKCPPPLPRFICMWNVGAAMVMVPKQRRLVPLARTNFVGQHPVIMKQSWLNYLLAQQTGRNPDGIVCAPKKLRGFNWAGHAVNNRSRYMF